MLYNLQLHIPFLRINKIRYILKNSLRGEVGLLNSCNLCLYRHLIQAMYNKIIYSLLCSFLPWFREGGYIGLFNYYTMSPKFNKNVFLFVGLTTLGTLIEFWLVGLLSWVSNVSTTYYSLQNGCFCVWSLGKYINL